MFGLAEPGVGWISRRGDETAGAGPGMTTKRMEATRFHLIALPNSRRPPWPWAHGPPWYTTEVLATMTNHPSAGPRRIAAVCWFKVLTVPLRDRGQNRDADLCPSPASNSRRATKHPGQTRTRAGQLMPGMPDRATEAVYVHAPALCAAGAMSIRGCSRIAEISVS